MGAFVFAVILTAAVGSPPSISRIAGTLAVTIAGGVFCGGIVAGRTLLLLGRTEDCLVEITFTTVAADGSFLLAEHFHFSGVPASPSAGLLVGDLGCLGAISARGRETITAYCEYLDFLANSLIFISIGMHDSHENFVRAWVPAIIAIRLVMLGRAFAVYPCCAVFGRSVLRVQGKHQLVLFWGGLRVALALVLALGHTPKANSDTGYGDVLSGEYDIIQGITRQYFSGEVSMNIDNGIAKVAYEFYVKRGCGSGREVEYWLTAERIVRARRTERPFEGNEAGNPRQKPAATATREKAAKPGRRISATQEQTRQEKEEDRMIEHRRAAWGNQEHGEQAFSMFRHTVLRLRHQLLTSCSYHAETRRASCG